VLSQTILSVLTQNKMFDKNFICYAVYVLLIMNLMNVSAEGSRTYSACDDDLPKEKADEFAICRSQLPQLLKGKS